MPGGDRTRWTLEGVTEDRGPEVLEVPVRRVLDGRLVGTEVVVRRPAGPRRSLRVDAIGLGPALATLQARRREGIDTGMLVRATSSCLRDPALLDEGVQRIAAAALPHGRLTVSVDEGAVLDDWARAEDLLHRLGDLGCALVLDEAGFGFSAVAALRDLPLAGVRFDRLLTASATASARSRTLLRALVELAREHGLLTLVGPVEDADGLRVARSAGAQLMHGPCAGAPRPLRVLPVW